MKRKTFQKRLMAFGIQRNEASALSRKIKAAYPVMKESDAIGTCILAHVMAPTQVRMETCAGYYMNAYTEICPNGPVLPNLFLPVLVALQAAERMITEIAFRRAEDALFYADNTIVLQADPKQYPDLVQCIARGKAVLDRW